MDFINNMTEEELTKAIENGLARREHNDKMHERYKNDPDYGIIPEKPVMVEGRKYREAYVNSLLDEYGRSINAVRTGNITANNIGGVSDIYELRDSSGAFLSKIFLNIYSITRSIQAPKGLSLNNIEQLKVFPVNEQDTMFDDMLMGAQPILPHSSTNAVFPSQPSADEVNKSGDNNIEEKNSNDISKQAEINYILCQSCGAKLPMDSDFCQKCGEPVKKEKGTNNIEMIFCRKCGAKNPSDSAFCVKCGSSVETANSENEIKSKPEIIYDPNRYNNVEKKNKKAQKRLGIDPFIIGIIAVVVVCVAVLLIAFLKDEPKKEVQVNDASSVVTSSIKEEPTPTVEAIEAENSEDLKREDFVTQDNDYDLSWAGEYEGYVTFGTDKTAYYVPSEWASYENMVFNKKNENNEPLWGFLTDQGIVLVVCRDLSSYGNTPIERLSKFREEQQIQEDINTDFFNYPAIMSSYVGSLTGDEESRFVEIKICGGKECLLFTLVMDNVEVDEEHLRTIADVALNAKFKE